MVNITQVASGDECQTDARIECKGESHSPVGWGENREREVVEG